MGVVGAFSGYCLFRVLRWARVPVFPAAFAAGLLSDWATYAVAALELAAGTHENVSIAAMFLVYAAVFVPTQIPLGIADGVMTAVAYRFVRLRRPELLGIGRQEVRGLSQFRAPCEAWSDENGTVPFAPASLTGEKT
jgi:cobalt/nickel transport system permease protein